MSFYAPLDRPATSALQESHRSFAMTYPHSVFYDASYCAFGGLTSSGPHADDLLRYAKTTDSFFVLGDKPTVPDNLQITTGLICHQMVLENPIITENTTRIEPLTKPLQQNELKSLINQIQPGYFREQTLALGDYYGIYRDKKLVAVCGERMSMHQFTELSGIVTMPNYRGKGFAKQLIAHSSQQIFDQQKTPFLHVLSSNHTAIKLYQSLGFRTRKEIIFWKVEHHH